MNKVEVYIRKEMERNVPVASIRKALLDVGHDIEKVDAHLRKEEEKRVRKKIMSDTSLGMKFDADILRYIDQSIESGHSLEEISENLEEAGRKIKKHQKHKPKISVFLVLAIVMICFIVWAFFFHKLPEGQPTDLELCSYDCKDKECIDDCYDGYYYSRAVDRDNASFCVDISSAELRAVCNDEILSTIAIRDTSIETCGGILNTTRKEDCIATVIISRASAESNISLCDSLPIEGQMQDCRDNYIHNQAVRNMDMNLCNEIEATDRKTSCRNTIIERTAVANGNITLCDTLEDKLHCKDEFYYGIAIKDRNVEECQKINDTSRKGLCQNIVYQRRAIMENNPKLCDWITDMKILDNCRRNA